MVLQAGYLKIDGPANRSRSLSRARGRGPGAFGGVRCTGSGKGVSILRVLVVAVVSLADQAMRRQG